MWVIDSPRPRMQSVSFVTEYPAAGQSVRYCDRFHTHPSVSSKTLVPVVLPRMRTSWLVSVLSENGNEVELVELLVLYPGVPGNGFGAVLGGASGLVIMKSGVPPTMRPNA
jgi:hypothetical protein